MIFTRRTIHRQFQIFTRHCAQNNPDRFIASEDAIMRKGRRTFQNLLGEFSNPTEPRSSLFCEEHATVAKSRCGGGGGRVGWNVLSWRNAGVSSRPIPHSGLAVSPVLCNREWGFQICLPPRVPIPFPLTKWCHKPSMCYNTLITLLQGYGCFGRRVEPVECISGWYVRRTTSTHKWSRTM